ncbi:SDR family oxidoreductase [Alkalicoccus chagannorensis]|uniref:SDR family oxidoreductase n=1 Tax=Alkalicoccus chagannorensis TaxID=427072 RepID=UPI00040DDD93|nr:SDR family oxidoreductase [Alkalicoccus chagannorensis]
MKEGRDPCPLKGKHFLVTGVSRKQGIGAHTAALAASYGASLTIQHFQPHDAEQAWGADDLSSVKESIREHLHEDAFLHDQSVDFMKPGAAERLVIEAAAVQPLSGVVCIHAMSGSDGELADMSEDKLQRHYMVNTAASIMMAKAYAAVALEYGRILFMTSGQSQGPMPGEVAYAASKAAIAGVTLTLSDELAPRGITVNTVNPGPVDTGYLSDAAWQEVRSRFPFGRFGKPEDPARLLAWLMTEESRWITGQVIHSEGGFARWN